ncbi:helix-turn-helix transcriptional regulator [Ensifer soli]|uniref:helix-turn-helix transcriptional regulator n=1 Tax=Ciceribacter sp. sgz301302 TaxID=3342379 RepID=UPI0035B93F7A
MERDVLIDRIYEAAMIPDGWSDVCDLISAEVDAFSAAVISISPDGAVRWVASECVTEDMRRYQDSGLAAENKRLIRALQSGDTSFKRDIDVLTAEEFENDSMLRELLRPIGLGWEMGAAVREPSGTMLVHSLLRRTEHGPFTPDHVERINGLRPDLARATFMAGRLGFEEARTMARTLDLVGLPAAVIGDGGQVVAMNAGMDAMGPRIRTGFMDRLVLSDTQAAALLQDIFERLQRGFAPLVQSVPVAAGEAAPPLVLQVIPIRRDARDIFARSRAVVIATTVGVAGPPDQRVLCGLFDLTRLEARVAQEVTRGLSVEETAGRLGIGRETVRTHLKAVFRKTGVGRQSQLVALLSGLGRPSDAA